MLPELRTSSGAHSFGCIHRHPVCWEGLALQNARRARCTPGLTESVLVQSILTATMDAFMTDTQRNLIMNFYFWNDVSHV